MLLCCFLFNIIILFVKKSKYRKFKSFYQFSYCHRYFRIITGSAFSIRRSKAKINDDPEPEAKPLRKYKPGYLGKGENSVSVTHYCFLYEIKTLQSQNQVSFIYKCPLLNLIRKRNNIFLFLLFCSRSI